MRIIIAGLLLICSLNSFCQKNKGYASISGSFDIRDNAQGYGALFSGNTRIGPGSFLGIESGLIKLKGLDAPYIPLFGKITVAPNFEKEKLSLLVVLEPGYGIYNHKTSIGNSYITTKGGFDFYGGLGAVTSSKSKAHAFVTIGYSRYGFSIEEITSKVEMVGVRIGVMFK